MAEEKLVDFGTVKIPEQYIKGTRFGRVNIPELIESTEGRFGSPQPARIVLARLEEKGVVFDKSGDRGRTLPGAYYNTLFNGGGGQHADGVAAMLNLGRESEPLQIGVPSTVTWRGITAPLDLWHRETDAPDSFFISKLADDGGRDVIANLRGHGVVFNPPPAFKGSAEDYQKQLSEAYSRAAYSDKKTFIKPTTLSAVQAMMDYHLEQFPDPAAPASTAPEETQTSSQPSASANWVPPGEIKYPPELPHFPSPAPPAMQTASAPAKNPASLLGTPSENNPSGPGYTDILKKASFAPPQKPAAPPPPPARLSPQAVKDLRSLLKHKTLNRGGEVGHEVQDALVQAAGDVDKAIGLLHEKGITATPSKLQDGKVGPITRALAEDPTVKINLEKRLKENTPAPEEKAVKLPLPKPDPRRKPGYSPNAGH